MDFRDDLGWPSPAINYLRSRCRNAMILLDLQNCDLGYAPTVSLEDGLALQVRAAMDDPVEAVA